MTPRNPFVKKVITFPWKTKREKYAIMILKAVLSNPNSRLVHAYQTEEELITCCLSLADKFCKGLEK